MRYLLIALLLTMTAASAQTVNGQAPSSDKPQTQGTPAPTSATPGTTTQSAPAIDQKFIDAAVKAVGSKEAAARIEITRGWKHLKQGDLEVAIQSFTHAYVLDPKNVEVYWGLGNAMTQQGKFAAASTYYERAIKIDPQNPKLMADIGLSQIYSAFKSSPDREMQAKLAKDAMQWFDNAEKIDPNRAVIYAHRAIGLYMLGNYSDAWKNVEKAEALDRSSIDPRFLADLTAKQARPATGKAPVKSNEPPVKTEAVSTPPTVQPLPPKAADDKASAPLPTTKLSPAIRDGRGEKISSPAPASPAARTPDAAPTGVAPPQAAKPDVQPAATPTTKDAAPEETPKDAAAPSQEKPLRVIQDKTLPEIGPDKRKCLDLPTNEEIIRCVYPPK